MVPLSGICQDQICVTLLIWVWMVAERRREVRQGDREEHGLHKTLIAMVCSCDTMKRAGVTGAVLGEILRSAVLVLLPCTFLLPAGKKLLYPKLPVMNWYLLCCPAFFFLSKKPHPRLHDTTWWMYAHRTSPVVGVQQPNKKEQLKDGSRCTDELCCPSLYRLAKLGA